MNKIKDADRAINYERYERQIILDSFGIEGQEKLKKAKVLIIGAGGLGSPTAMYLAGAGIGTIGIADADEVSISNLHRQIMHPSCRTGENKAESAKESMLALNDEVRVITYPYFLTEENIEEILPLYDFVLLCVDNFETRFLVNDACVALGIPFSHAGVIAYEGQLLSYVPGKGPCYRCIFEDIPEEGTVPTAKEIGILGPMAGAIGSLQALEAIKYLTGIGEMLTGRMYILDGLSMQSRIAKFPKASCYCPACNRKMKR